MHFVTDWRFLTPRWLKKEYEDFLYISSLCPREGKLLQFLYIGYWPDSFSQRLCPWSISDLAVWKHWWIFLPSLSSHQPTRGAKSERGSPRRGKGVGGCSFSGQWFENSRWFSKWTHNKHTETAKRESARSEMSLKRQLSVITRHYAVGRCFSGHSRCAML